MDLTIEKLIYGGDGLAHLPADEHGPGKAVFVPFALEGERVEVTLVEQKPGFSRAHADRVLSPSRQRVSAQCPYFTRCGGCHYQHSNYDHQLEIKSSILKENLRRIAKLELACELKIHPSPPWNYRNRTRLRVKRIPVFALGYYKLNSHELLSVEECPISSPLINRAIKAIWTLGRAGEFGTSVEEIELFSNEDNQLLVEAYAGSYIASNKGRGIPLREFEADTVEVWTEKLQKELPETIGVVLFQGTGPDGFGLLKTVGQNQLIYKTKHASYRVSAGSFFQTNRHLNDELVDIVTAGRSGRTALDLYAGVGLFSVVLSREFEHVIAVDTSHQSAADLEYNSTANVKALRSTVDHYVSNVVGRLRPDLIVVDPPRSGLREKLAMNLAGLGAERITYVSCDPATLARDLVPLLTAGYHVEEAHLLDLFPQTFHLESVLHLAL